MFKKTEKGLAFNGILVIVFILVAIGFIVWYVFGNFIESSRVKDAERVIAVAVDAQDQYMMSRGRYTQNWTALNAAPLAPYMKQKGEYVSTDGTIFMNKGGGMTTPNDGFKMYFDYVDGQLFVVAERVGGQYHYTLVRPVLKGTTYCVPSANPLDGKFCMGYMNVKDISSIPADPRPSYYDEEEVEEE